MTQQIEKDLYNRLLDLYIEQEALKDAVKNAKSDNTYHEDDNPKGLQKDVVAAIDASAKASIKNNFEELQEKFTLFQEKYSELAG